MTPSTDTPMREGSRDGQGGCLVCGKDTPSRRARSTVGELTSNVVTGSAIKPPPPI